VRGFTQKTENTTYLDGLLNFPQFLLDRLQSGEGFQCGFLVVVQLFRVGGSIG
jgi:hypothetical protein